MVEKTLSEVRVRWFLYAQDLPACLEIERLSISRPWPEARWRRRHRCASVIVHVAEIGDRIVGFSSHENLPKLISLDRLAVHPAYRRRGVGTLLVDRLVRALHPQGRNRIFAIFPERSLEAQLLFRSRGFVASEIMRRERKSDSYLFELGVGPVAPPRRAFEEARG